MREEHLDAVTAIENAAFSMPWPREAFTPHRSYAGRARSLVLLDAERPEKGVQGYICYWIGKLEMEIQNIAVRSGSRRRGGATYLLEVAFDEARRKGRRHAFLEVRPSNAAGLALYGRWGFETVDRRKTYYSDGEDALLLRAEVSRKRRGAARKPGRPSLKGRRSGC
jgi:ribosomal-protein-alanine N-acetyltransferase